MHISLLSTGPYQLTFKCRVMSPQPSFYHKQPGDEETTVTVCTLNEMDREQYKTLFADILISYEQLEIGKSIGEGIDTCSWIMLQFFK